MIDLNENELQKVTESASGEWDNREVTSEHTGMTFSTAIPCQLKMKGDDIKQDTDKFHEQLDKNGYSPIDNNPDRRISEADQNIYYEGEVMIQDKYNRIRVLIFREDIIRLYPIDDYVPTNDELYNLIEAICTGFNTTVVHQPIDTK